MSNLRTTIKQIPLAHSFYKLSSKIICAIKSPSFISEYRTFRSLSKSNRLPISWDHNSAVFSEKTATTGFDRHYVYHTSWAARCVAQTKPAKHVDISSSLYFAGICSAFSEIEFYDFRPADLLLSNLTCKSADLTNLHFESNSIPSLSCMHTVEHIGLGRYGDPIDPEGDLKAINELQRVLAKNGNLFFVVPVGEPRIEFNAHRIYSPEQITGYFKDLKLESFTLIGEEFSQGGLIVNPSKDLLDKQRYGCGCFWFKKI